jgi:hypothetical protein
MRIRTAPPFVERALGRARLCSVYAGSGLCIRAPNGELEGVVRSGISPQGVRPVVYYSPGMFFRGGPLFVRFRQRARQHLLAGRRAETTTGLGGPDQAHVFRMQPEHLLTACGGNANQALR